MMNKEKKDNLAPSLRFPEFVKKPTWKDRKLSEVLLEHDERSTGKEEVFGYSGDADPGTGHADPLLDFGLAKLIA